MSDNEIRVQNIKEQFISIYTNNIHRAGADELLDALEKSDFFTMPASARFHLSRPGGLAEHSIDTYIRLRQLYVLHKTTEKELDTPYVLTDAEEETIAIVGLLHDLCKYNIYESSLKSRKTGRKLPNGRDEWEDYTGFSFHDRRPLAGHGARSVILAMQHIKLKTSEIMAISWHMGYSDATFKGGDNSVSTAFDMCPLAVLTHMADLWASHIDETKPEKKIGGANA